MIRNRTFHRVMWCFYGSLTLLRGCLVWVHTHPVRYGQLAAAPLPSKPSQLQGRGSWIPLLAWIRLFQGTSSLFFAECLILQLCLGVYWECFILIKLRSHEMNLYYVSYLVSTKSKCKCSTVEHRWMKIQICPYVQLLWDHSMVLSQLCAFLKKPGHFMLRRKVIWYKAFLLFIQSTTDPDV